jgi:cytochrome c oxidase subunit 3
MNSALLYKRAGPGGGDGGPWPRGLPASRRADPFSIALWIFFGVAGSLFSLFIAAYLMRMQESDWSPIGMPPQLWVSTALLAAGSLALQRAAIAARAGRRRPASLLLLAGGVCALAFLGVQSWAWQALLGAQVRPAGNAAAGFFYLLTAMHGLHVAGGLAGWWIALRRWRRQGPAAAQAIRLCARYWHFLLAVWVVLFAALGWLTPDVMRAICGTA